MVRGNRFEPDREDGIDEPSSDADASLSPSTIEGLEALDRAVTTSRELRTALELAEEIFSNARTHVARGMPVIDALEKGNVPFSTDRQRRSDAFDAYARGRQHLRVTAIRSGLGLGLSITELARRLGVSRQRISQVARAGGLSDTRGWGSGGQRED